MRRLAYGPRDARVLLIGEAPSRATEEPDRILVRKDLAELAGVEFPEEWVSLFARANVLETWPGPALSGKGDAFPMPEARRRVRLLLPLLERPDRILTVLLGRRVEAAFGVGHGTFFDMRLTDGGASYVVAPHPSRVSRWWNDPLNVAAAESFWRRVARLARSSG